MSAPIKQPPLPGMKKPARPVRTLPLWMSELHLVRRALLCFGATLVASLVLLSVSLGYRERQAQQLEQAQKSRMAAASLFNHVEAEKLEIRTYAPRFQALQQRGLIGEENRLAWIDAISRSQARLKLLPLTYDISAQQVLKVPLPLSMGQYQLRGSKMQLHLDLLHEMDLLTFLNDLRHTGYFAVQDCALKRSGAGNQAAVPAAASGGANMAGGAGTAAVASAAPTLSADCSLLWLTLGNAPAQARGQP